MRPQCAPHPAMGRSVAGIESGLETGRPAGLALGMLCAMLQQPAGLFPAASAEQRAVRDELEAAVAASFESAAGKGHGGTAPAAAAEAAADAAGSAAEAHAPRPRLEAAVAAAQAAASDWSSAIAGPNAGGGAASVRVVSVANADTLAPAAKACALAPGLPQRLWSPEGPNGAGPPPGEPVRDSPLPLAPCPLPSCRPLLAAVRPSGDTVPRRRSWMWHWSCNLAAGRASCSGASWRRARRPLVQAEAHAVPAGCSQ